MDSGSSRSNDLCFVNLHDGPHRHHTSSATPSTLSQIDENMNCRKLILTLNRALSNEELQSIKFLFGGEIKKRKMEKIKTLMDLFTTLKERGLLREDSLGCLVEALQEINRQDLVQLVRNYTCQNEVGFNSFSLSATDFAQQVESESTTSQQVSRIHEEHTINEVTSEHNAQQETITALRTTTDQETQTLDVERLSGDYYSEMLLRLEMNELLASNQYELFEQFPEISKLYMLRSEKGQKFLQSKLLRVYPQLLYPDIYC